MWESLCPDLIGAGHATCHHSFDSRALTRTLCVSERRQQLSCFTTRKKPMQPKIISEQPAKNTTSKIPSSMMALDSSSCGRSIDSFSYSAGNYICILIGKVRASSVLLRRLPGTSDAPTRHTINFLSDSTSYRYETTR